MTDGYKNEELKGRGCIQMIYPKNDWYYSPIENKEVWDFSGSTISGSFIAEIKIRYNASDTYETALLEKKKYENLKAIAESNNLTMFYFNVHSEATMIYNLSNLPVTAYTRDFVRCPVSSSEEKGWERKEVIYLPINEVSKKIDIGYNNLKR